MDFMSSGDRVLQVSCSEHNLLEEFNMTVVLIGGQLTEDSIGIQSKDAGIYVEEREDAARVTILLNLFHHLNYSIRLSEDFLAFTGEVVTERKSSLQLCGILPSRIKYLNCPIYM